MADPVRIDIVSDIMCPWCVIGWRQLVQALDETGVTARVHWHPFELNPNMPRAGQDLREHVAGKYGTTPKDSDRARDRITELGATLGFTFNFNDNSRIVNSFRAHQLVEWADGFGQQQAAHLALFRAHFTDGRDVSDPEVLVAVAGELGLDGAAFRAAMDGDTLVQTVRTMQNFWIGKGIRGVPSMVFNLRALVTGAQGVAIYAQQVQPFAAQTES